MLCAILIKSQSNRGPGQSLRERRWSCRILDNLDLGSKHTSFNAWSQALSLTFLPHFQNSKPWQDPGLHPPNVEDPRRASWGSTTGIRFGYKLESSSEPRSWEGKGKTIGEHTSCWCSFPFCSISGGTRPHLELCPHRRPCLHYAVNSIPTLASATGN